MIEIAAVPFHEVIPEIAPNVERHYNEMNEGDDNGAFDMDWDYYHQLSLSGACICITARDDGKLIGYSIYDIGTSPRYKDMLEASSSGLFVEKEYRDGKTAKRMIQAADAVMKSIGVKETSYTSNDEQFGKFLERAGAKQTYKIWSVSHGV